MAIFICFSSKLNLLLLILTSSKSRKQAKLNGYIAINYTSFKLYKNASLKAIEWIFSTEIGIFWLVDLEVIGKMPSFVKITWSELHGSEKPENVWLMKYHVLKMTAFNFGGDGFVFFNRKNKTKKWSQKTVENLHQNFDTTYKIV